MSVFTGVEQDAMELYVVNSVPTYGGIERLNFLAHLSSMVASGQSCGATLGIVVDYLLKTDV
jgi:hypothetical protein